MIVDHLNIFDSTDKIIDPSGWDGTGFIDFTMLTNNSITVDVKLVSSADDNIHIGKNLPIPSGSALNALTGKVVMETGDILRVQSDTANSADIALSVMEVT